MKKSPAIVAAAVLAFAAGALSGGFLPRAEASGAVRDEAPSHVTVVPGHEPYTFDIVIVQGDRLYVTRYPEGNEKPLELKPHAILGK